jgi:hypothetical protein
VKTIAPFAAVGVALIAAGIALALALGQGNAAAAVRTQNAGLASQVAQLRAANASLSAQISAVKAAATTQQAATAANLGLCVSTNYNTNGDGDVSSVYISSPNVTSGGAVSCPSGIFVPVSPQHVR